MRVGIEGSGNYGRPGAEALITAGVPTVEVPPQMTAAARRTRRTRTNTDSVDALEIARIAARDDDLAALVRYRREVTKDPTAAINRLHSTLEKTRCRYHTRTGPLTSTRGLDAAAALQCGDPSARAAVAKDRIAGIRRLDRTIAKLTEQITHTITRSGTSLTGIYGVGPLIAADIVAEVGDPARFATKDRFAAANGTAPIEASSHRVVRHRLNRGGNRLHLAAIAQISRPGTEGRAHYQRCLDRGKSKREAIRAHKRRISDRVWTRLQTDLRTQTRALG